MTPEWPVIHAPSKTSRIRVVDFALTAAAWASILAMIARAVMPALTDHTTLGAHDWDEMESERWLVVKSLREFHQFPFWNPYACGGFNAWGSIQGDTVVISPWLLAYLFAPFAIAVRIEVVGIALISALGTWLFAGRFTRSPAMRAFVCVVFVVNGRWALQVATGHAWHLYYAYTPWVLYFFDRALLPGSKTWWRDTFFCGAFVALMVYAGGIYPEPQTALVVVVYAAALALLRRDSKPLAVGAVVAAFGAALAAPKLFSILENIARWPRLTESNESIDLHAFVQLLIERNQDVSVPAAAVPFWGWHEYGMYIGWVSFFVIALSLMFARGQRIRALKWVAFVTIILGFGNFHRMSPWAIVHEWPLFKSQHVPSRWLYPAVLVCGVIAAGAMESVLARMPLGRKLAEALLVVIVASVGMDVADVSSRAMTHAFWMKLRPIPVAKEYYQERDVPPELEYVVGDYAPPALPATMAGVGVLRCTLHPGLNIFAPLASSGGRPIGMGALGRGDPKYEGEAYLASGKGTAKIAKFTPNAVTVTVTGARPGDLLVLNQNWDAGWRGNGVRATNYQDAVAVVVAMSDETVVFTYVSPWLWPGLLCAGAAIILFAAGPRLRRRPALSRWLLG